MNEGKEEEEEDEDKEEEVEEEDEERRGGGIEGLGGRGEVKWRSEEGVDKRSRMMMK